MPRSHLTSLDSPTSPPPGEAGAQASSPDAPPAHTSSPDEAAHLVGQLHSLQQLLNAERRALRAMDRELVEARETLARLQSGLAFRAATKLWALKDALAPEKSRRRRGYDLLKSRLRRR